MSKGFSRVLTRDCSPEVWQGASLLIFAACDEDYIGNALALIKSLDRMSPGFDFLLHLVNAKDELIEDVLAFADELEATRLHVTAERVQLGSPEEARTYYASARLIRLAEMLPGSGTPIFAMDADGIFIAPIDLDFSDKHAAEICLPVRDIANERRPLHLRVAAGAIWVRPTQGACRFFRAVADDLLDAFARREASWFLDQYLLAKHVIAKTGNALVLNIKRKYVDWDFRSDAVVWTGKGKRKHLDIGYLLLRSCFDRDGDRRALARGLWSDTRHLVGARTEDVLARLFEADRQQACKRFAIYLPRLDLPWKRAAMGRGGPPAQSEDTIQLRLWWKRFAMAVSQALTRHGFEVSTIEIPAWDITPARVDSDGYDFAFVPHRSHLDFVQGSTPVMFYMQEYFPHVFVADPQGWSASSSVYPVDAARLPGAVLGAWDAYRERYQKGELESKFRQAVSLTRLQLEARGDLPVGPYMFFPLQIPHDQSLIYFSDLSQMEALEAVVELAEHEKLTLVLKEHPANRASAREYREKFAGRVFWSDAHVHDLIRHARGVVALNSGVGFETIVIGKPLVTLARAEYDAVSHAARLTDLAESWRAAIAEDSEQRMTRYARFVDWFLARHAVDLSRPQSAAYSIDRVVKRAVQLLAEAA